MFLIEVIPLTKIASSGSQALSYFSSQEIKNRGLVLIPIGRREEKAIVISCHPVREKKLEIKKSTFQLRPISKIISPEPVLTEEQFSLAQWLADYYLASLGIVLKLFLPKSILNRKKIQKSETLSLVQPLLPKTEQKNPILLWLEKRDKEYLKETEKIIKQGKTVLFLVPETYSIQKYVSLLKNASSKIAAAQSDLKSSQQTKIWQEVSQDKIDIIVGTRTSLFLPFTNLGLIIVDQEENENYKSWDQTPRYHTRTAALKLANAFGAKIILGTSLPSIDSYFYATRKKFSLKKVGQLRNHQVAKTHIVDMKEEIRKENFSMFSEFLENKIKNTLKNGKQSILFINRRGLASAVLCRDCGYIIKCQDCDAAMVFHKDFNNQKEILVCHHCGKTMNVPNICPKCKSWRIKFFGTGTEKAIEELKKIIGLEARIARLDSDIAPTHQQQEKILTDFQKKNYDVLVGTQLLLKLKTLKKTTDKIDLAGVIIIDPMLNLPEFRSAEKTMRLLFKLKSLAKAMVIQTYNPEFYLFSFLPENNIKNFFEQELENRKMFGYPPFSKIIKLTFSHKNPKTAKTEAQKTKKALRKALPQLKILGPAPAYIPLVKNKYIWNIILKTSKRDLKQTQIIKQLIGPDWLIDIEPQSLL